MSYAPELVDELRRRKGLSPMGPPNPLDISAVPAKPDLNPSLSEEEIANVGAADPADVEAATAMLEQQARPSSVPAQVQQAVTGAVPPEEDEMWLARDADRQARNAGRMELAAKQLVAGVTQTPQAQVSAAPPAQAPQVAAAQKSRRQQLVDELERKRQGTLDESRLKHEAAATEATNYKNSPEARNAALAEALRKRQEAEAAKTESARRFEAQLAAQKENSAAMRGMSAASLGISKEKWDAEKAEKAKGKPLTDSTITDLADTDTALRSLGALGEKFVSLGQEGMAAKLSGKVSGALGLTSTDAGQYLAAARLSMQGVGKIMEGGKLAAGDETKYMGMLPVPGDSFESAGIKIKAAQNYLRGLRDDRVAALKAAGRDVPSFGGKPSTGERKRVKNAAGKMGWWDGTSPLPPGVEVVDG